jgi:site-specific recombinase XerD
MPPKSPSSDTPARNRLTPIKETIHSIRGYPSKLIIYQTDASKYFWTRIYFNNKYHYKSTKTESVTDAKKFAVKFYEQILVTANVERTSDKTKSFAVVASRYFKSVEKTTTKTVHRTDLSRYKTDILPVFGEQEIDTITNSQVSVLINRLKERDLSVASIKHYLVVLRKILKFAVANDLMQHIPMFPKVQGRVLTAQKRDYLTQEEYEELVASAEKLANDKVIERGVLITDEMKYLIQFMVNSFIRPSDIRVLKHKHIKKKKEGKDTWLVLNHPATKTNATEVQAMPASVHIYDRLVKFKTEHLMPVGLDDYVFLSEYSNRNTAMEVLGRLFRKILEDSEIEKKTGKNVTLYSLRHTSIMMRLVIGRVDSLALARNARTSQQMVDKFYASHLTTQHVRKQLHAFPEAEEKARVVAAKKSAKESAPKKTITKKPAPKKTTKTVAKKSDTNAKKPRVVAKKNMTKV